MNEAEKSLSWVVYLRTLYNSEQRVNAVCEQSEWDAMELAQPGRHTLVRAGISNEAEAERLARGTAGDALGGRRH